jgi:hypothetical protein
MTRDDIIRLAREAELFNDDQEPLSEHLERFAALVAAVEREACAKVCEELESQRINSSSLSGMIFGSSAEECAAAIRARGEA